MEATERGAGGESRAGVRGVDRRHLFPGRTKQVFVRLSKEEYDDIAAAAVRRDLTPTGYVAEAALSAARATPQAEGQPYESVITRSELAHLQRQLFAARAALTRLFDDLHQAVAATYTTGQPDALHGALPRFRRVLDQVDAVIGWIDGSLR